VSIEKRVGTIANAAGRVCCASTALPYLIGNTPCQSEIRNLRIRTAATSCCLRTALSKATTSAANNFNSIVAVVPVRRHRPRRLPTVSKKDSALAAAYVRPGTAGNGKSLLRCRDDNERSHRHDERKAKD
jgi:hypothetical protein